MKIVNWLKEAGLYLVLMSNDKLVVDVETIARYISYRGYMDDRDELLDEDS